MAAQAMDKLEKYRSLVKEILAEYTRFPPSHGEIEPVLIFDDEHSSYQLMFIGWDTDRRVHTVAIHIRLRNDKIWIEWDGTHESIALKLVEKGVPQEDIVLGFQPPETRRFTEFAIA